jgi:hypothetical protein
MNNWSICWFSRIFLLGILIFEGLTARRLYKLFGVKGLMSGWKIRNEVEKSVMPTFDVSKWREQRNLRTTFDSTECERSELETFWVWNQLPIWWSSVAKFRQSWQRRIADAEYFFKSQVANMAVTLEPLLLNIVIYTWKRYCCNFRTLVDSGTDFVKILLYIHRFKTPYMSAVCVRLFLYASIILKIYW